MVSAGAGCEEASFFPALASSSSTTTCPAKSGLFLTPLLIHYRNSELTTITATGMATVTPFPPVAANDVCWQ